MKKTSIILIIIGVAVTVACIFYFGTALNVADSDPMTVNPHGVRTSLWPIFIGILTTFVGICFYLISVADEKKAKK